MKNSGIGFVFTLLVTFGFAAPVRAAPSSCPAAAARFLSGTWQGNAVLTLPSGVSQESETRDIFSVLDCKTFEVTVNYLDSAGAITRVLHFLAIADESGEPGLFRLFNGTITEGSSVGATTGTINIPQEGTLQGQFLGAVGGKPAYLSEVMNVSGNQLTRTIQMHAGNQNGPYIGTRVVHDIKVR